MPLFPSNFLKFHLELAAVVRSSPLTICLRVLIITQHASSLSFVSFHLTKPVCLPCYLHAVCLSQWLRGAHTHSVCLYFPTNERGAPAVIGDIISMRHMPLYGSEILVYSNLFVMMQHFGTWQQRTPSACCPGYSILILSWHVSLFKAVLSLSLERVMCFSHITPHRGLLTSNFQFPL